MLLQCFPRPSAISPHAHPLRVCLDVGGRQWILSPPRPCHFRRLLLVVPPFIRLLAAAILDAPHTSAAIDTAAVSPAASARRAGVPLLAGVAATGGLRGKSSTRACCSTDSTALKRQRRFPPGPLQTFALLTFYSSLHALRAPAAVAAAPLFSAASSFGAASLRSRSRFPPAAVVSPPSSAFTGACTTQPSACEHWFGASTAAASVLRRPHTRPPARDFAARSSSNSGSSGCGSPGRKPRAAKRSPHISEQFFISEKTTSHFRASHRSSTGSSQEESSSSSSDISENGEGASCNSKVHSSEIFGSAPLSRISPDNHLRRMLPSSGTNSGQILSGRTSRCTTAVASPCADRPSPPLLVFPAAPTFSFPPARYARCVTAASAGNVPAPAAVALPAAVAIPAAVAYCTAPAVAGLPADSAASDTALLFAAVFLTRCMCGALLSPVPACRTAERVAVARSSPLPLSSSLSPTFLLSSFRSLCSSASLPSSAVTHAVCRPAGCRSAVRRPAAPLAPAAAAPAAAASVVTHEVPAAAASTWALEKTAAAAATASSSSCRSLRTPTHASQPRARAAASFLSRHFVTFTSAHRSGAGDPFFSGAAFRPAASSAPASAVAFAAAAAAPRLPVAAAAAATRLRGSFTVSAAPRGSVFAAAAAAPWWTGAAMGHPSEAAADGSGAAAATAGGAAAAEGGRGSGNAGGKLVAGDSARAPADAAEDCNEAGVLCSGASEKSSSTAATSGAGQGEENDAAGGAAAAASKKAQKKKEKEAAKAAAQAAKREAHEAEQRAAQALLQKKVECPTGKDTFGYLPLTWKSATNTGAAPRVWSSLGSLQQLLQHHRQQQQKREGGGAAGGEKDEEETAKDEDGTLVWVRGRIQESRGKGGLAFLLLREKGATVQCVLDAKRGEISKEMIKWTISLPLESVVDVQGVVVPAAVTVQAATEQQIELLPRRIYCVSAAAQVLPFQFKDASRSADGATETTTPAPAEAVPRVALDTRLDHRVMDLRTAASQAVFSIVSATAALFREFLLQQHFVEIHSPKLIAGASEGGASCFTLQYFGRDACLAQSPQLYKQMAICGDFPRVFEIGPVFRAENSNTHRHLCEFTGVDLEMEIREDYTEVLDLVDNLFKHVFSGLETRCKKEIATFHAQYPAEPFVWQEQTPRLTFAEGVKLLRAAGCSGIPDDISSFDLNTEQEKFLGRIMKEKYNTDFYMLLQYPTKVRPFYTMPSPENPEFSNSYDFFMRTEEIISGAQRVHDSELLTKRCVDCGVHPASIQTYIDAFRLGAPPHGGAGIGLERVVMLFLGAKNIRQVSLFPRDPRRLTP